ncbi:hypothetical protein AX774_g7476 [Zancudomyces culisetae]|uniref:Uncharacterized protein n=1 Tax=Zancudomyces culisetae TaxID=1213189 RepID=A0A1R1PE10_ZANCU|nr:hypothetical protein AX774_g7476 [Zancudomyces culisetae]|eukprot:OMH79112.1 hypothetical protein AX774_g7476 [Zancudomyces culisetae]
MRGSIDQFQISIWNNCWPLLLFLQISCQISKPISFLVLSIFRNLNTTVCTEIALPFHKCHHTLITFLAFLCSAGSCCDTLGQYCIAQTVPQRDKLAMFRL